MLGVCATFTAVIGSWLLFCIELLFSCTCGVVVEVLRAALLPPKRHPASGQLYQLRTSSVLSLLRVFASANGSHLGDHTLLSWVGLGPLWSLPPPCQLFSSLFV